MKDGHAVYIYTIYIEPYERVLNKDYPGLRGKTELGVEDFIQHDQEVGHLELGLRDFGRELAAAARKSGA